jgi:ParB-like chromosome segregation protein Spo0J
MHVRDRVKELRRVRAGDLVPNPKNWRTHPQAQQDALRGLLAEIGYADALLVRELPDGRLMIVDGHLRAETTPDELVPVLVLDVDEEEADKLLLTLDPLAAMAEENAAAHEALMANVEFREEQLAEYIKRDLQKYLPEGYHNPLRIQQHN